MTGRNEVTPNQIGDTDNPDEYVVWGADAEGNVYNTYVVLRGTPSDELICETAKYNNNWNKIEGLKEAPTSLTPSEARAIREGL